MPSTVKRQSAAVMFTDIAGYTSIMASDEEKALSLLQEKTDNLELDVAAKFHSYPMPKAIVEEWEKLW